MKGLPPLSPRQQLLHDLTERMTIISAAIETLRKKYPKDAEVITDLEEACRRALEIFEKMRTS